MQIKHVKINCHFIYQLVGILTKTHTLARFHTLISNIMFLLIYYFNRIIGIKKWIEAHIISNFIQLKCYIIQFQKKKKIYITLSYKLTAVH